jgi:predicted RNA-binding protein YlqC (UPF0109 family)
MAEEQDQQFVEYVLKSIVDNPDDVQVERTIDEMGVLISVTVNPDDMGKVIGKSGQTAKAVRTLLKVVGAKNDARVNMKIIEPEGSEGPRATSTVGADTADSEGQAPQQGTTDAADDQVADAPSPVDDPAAVNDAQQIQQQTDAATIPQVDDDNSRVYEATAEVVEDEPPHVADSDQPTEARKDPIHERSPLDEL